jgi:hypothetical protein
MNPLIDCRSAAVSAIIRSVKFPGWLLGFFFGASLFAMPGSLRGQEPSASPTPSASEKEEITKTVDFPSADGKFAFLLGRGDYQQTIDLIDKKTEKVLQHIADDDMSSVYYKVLWAPDSKQFALMTRMGHPNQGVTVYFQKGDKFQEIEIPELIAEIPERLKRGKKFGHVASNNWQTAEKWNKDGSLLLTIDSTIDGSGYTASAVRTVLLGFDKSGKPKILKSSVKYESRKDSD